MSNKHSNNLRAVLSFLAAFALVTGAATAQSDDTVTYAIDADITNLDPIHAIDPGSAAVYLQINEPLVRINMEGDIVPVLATGWSVSEDNVTWTFELREGVTFHDGSAFNAEAVKAHFDRLLDPEQPNRSAGSFDMVAEVSAPTEYQVSFELTKPFAPFLALMTSPTATITSPTAVELYGNDYPFNPVGTGPWMFDS